MQRTTRVVTSDQVLLNRNKYANLRCRSFYRLWEITWHFLHRYIYFTAEFQLNKRFCRAFKLSYYVGFLLKYIKLCYFTLHLYIKYKNKWTKFFSINVFFNYNLGMLSNRCRRYMFFFLFFIAVFAHDSRTIWQILMKLDLVITYIVDSNHYMKK